ncbi:MAG: hypothetical protein K2Q23_08670, partial [Bryobacteraceae bacterium]|nr:hypothetical protein [Bryobacteraceae bacterium]
MNLILLLLIDRTIALLLQKSKSPAGWRGFHTLISNSPNGRAKLLLLGGLLSSLLGRLLCRLLGR